MQEVSEKYKHIIKKLKGYDWEDQQKISFNRTEAGLILELLERRERQLEKHRERYKANSEVLKKQSSDRYYANKEKIKARRLAEVFK